MLLKSNTILLVLVKKHFLTYRDTAESIIEEK